MDVIKLKANKTIGCLALFAAFTAPAWADSTNNSHRSILGQVGTTGIGLTLSKSQPQSKWVYRADAGYLNYDTRVREGNVDYDFKLDLTSAMISTDYHFFKGRFKGSLGLALLDSDLTLEGRPNGAGVYDINGQLVPAGQGDFVRAEIDLPTVAPYLGLGWSNLNDEQANFKYFADFGLIVGSIDTQLKTSQNVRNAAGDDNIEAERRKIDDAIDKGFLPVVRVGLGLSF